MRLSSCFSIALVENDEEVGSNGFEEVSEGESEETNGDEDGEEESRAEIDVGFEFDRFKNDNGDFERNEVCRDGDR